MPGETPGLIPENQEDLKAMGLKPEDLQSEKGSEVTNPKPSRLGETFLHERDSRLHISEPVEKTKERLKARGIAVSQKPAEKIGAYLDRFQAILNPEPLEGQRLDRRERNVDFLKGRLYKRVIIRPEDIPESYFQNQQRMAREQGHGDIEITPEQREQLTEVIISDQKSTLDNWVGYLTSPDSDSFPMWAKYWSFDGMLRLSTFDKEKHSFGKRDASTVAPFPDLNREALAYVVDAVVKKVGREAIAETEDNPEFQRLLQGANFGKLYAWAIEKVTPTEQNELLNTQGEWVKYPQGSDHMPLVASLQGHGTGWCTAGEETARSQLQGGDFYVYYSYDREGKPTIPRVAIRMEETNEIAEVRGIAPEQNLDPYIGGVLENKLRGFGREGEVYQKKTADMKRLTEIERRSKSGQELSKEYLRFLYEIGGKIQGFGYQADPRIEELKKGRNIKADLAVVLEFLEDEISITKKEALSGGIKFHYRNLHLDIRDSAKGLKLPQSVGGGLYLGNITSAQGLKFPDSVGSDLYLDSLNLAKGLKLPQSVGGGLYLGKLTSAEGLKLPESVGGDIYLSILSSAKGLELPKSIGGSLYLRQLTSAEGLKLPASVGGGLDLNSLTSAEGLKLPASVGGHLFLNSLTSAKGLKLPASVGGDLDLFSLSSAKGLKLPESVGGDLDLTNLASAEGLELPKSVGGGIYLRHLNPEEIAKLRQKYPEFEFL